MPGVSDAAMNLTSVLPDALLQCQACVDSSNPHHLDLQGAVLRLHLENKYSKSPRGGAAAQPTALSEPQLRWAAPRGSPEWLCSQAGPRGGHSAHRQGRGQRWGPQVRPREQS